MKKVQHEELCPFVKKARDKYFYSYTLCGVLGPLIDFFIKLTQGIVLHDAIALLATSAANFSAIIFFYLGYETFGRLFSCCLYYSYVSTLLFDPKETLNAPVTLVCCSMLVRNHFLYDKGRWKFISFGILFGDTILLLLKSFCFPPKEPIVLTAESIRTSLLISITPVVTCLSAEIYFDSVRQGVYNELKGYNERIVQATKEKEVFFACMSHEIRNPLQSLLGSVELLQHSQTKEQQASYTTIIKSGCEVVLNLVSNILDVSKIEAKKMELAQIPSSLNENVGKIVRLLSDRAKGKGIELKYVENGQLPPCLLFDPHRLHQIILNLASNAIKFTQKGRVVISVSWVPLSEDTGKEVAIKNELTNSEWKSILYPINEIEDEKAEFIKRQRVNSRFLPLPLRHQRKSSDRSPAPIHTGSTSREFPTFIPKSGLIKIEVMDTGIGISKAGLERLFKPFQQADSTISQNYGGTGLGLWISRCIVQLMGGDINVKSKVGLGTNMIVVFPSQTCPETAVLENGCSPLCLKAGVKGKKCLVVDDIPENTYILQELLQNNGVAVTTRNRAKEALELLMEGQTVDLIITDLRMPEMSGQDFILEVRKMERNRDLPRASIMVLTGESAPSEKVACLSQYGADEFILKPTKLGELMNCVEKLLLKKKNCKSKKNILLIDDDSVSQKIISSFIRHNGDIPKCCMNIRDAKDEFEKRWAKYDAIFLDNELPDGTGLDFMKFYEAFMMEKPYVKKIPVVSMSGNVVSDQERVYEGYKMHTFLQKPISKSVLTDIIKSIRQTLLLLIVYTTIINISSMCC
eukprot:TRINITY_DN135131_c0_g1_i1.p1 TRINITY_DN135131_c0_g1~~TRINITY_DN135131_c0_g1_i1.p1  ORF type:complete len:864 (-),score=72.16 TRINITY_DN135131_c0_g1_i1:48-2462(-)